MSQASVPVISWGLPVILPLKKWDSMFCWKCLLAKVENEGKKWFLPFLRTLRSPRLVSQFGYWACLCFSPTPFPRLSAKCFYDRNPQPSLSMVIIIVHSLESGPLGWGGMTSSDLILLATLCFCASEKVVWRWECMCMGRLEDTVCHLAHYKPLGSILVSVLWAGICLWEKWALFCSKALT